MGRKYTQPRVNRSHLAVESAGKKAGPTTPARIIMTSMAMMKRMFTIGAPAKRPRSRRRSGVVMSQSM